MRPKVLLVGALVLAAGSSPSAAQLPPLPSLPDVPEKVDEAKKQLDEGVKKAVGDAEQAAGEIVENAPAPPTRGGSGGEEGSGGEGGSGSEAPAGPAPAGTRGDGARTDDGVARSAPIHCPGEGRLGGGAGGGGPLNASPSSGVAGEVPSGEGVLGIGTGGGDGAGVLEQAARTGPLVLAMFALGALLLLVGFGGGVRALHGRLRSG